MTLRLSMTAPKKGGRMKTSPRITMKTALLFSAALICLFGSAAHGKPAKKTRHEFNSGMHFLSTSGIGSAQMFDVGKTLMDFLSRDTGDKWTIHRYDSMSAVYDDVLKGKLDSTPMWADDYVQLMERGADLQPWLTIRLKNGEKRAFCLWNAKSADMSDIKNITGKNLILDSYWPIWLLTLREYLAERGIDKPLWNVFGKFTKAPNQNSAYMTVALGKADFYWDTNDGDLYLKQYYPSMTKKIGHTFCTKPKYSRITVTLNRKTMGEKKVAEYQKWLKDFLPNINERTKSDPRLRQVLISTRNVIDHFDVASDDEFAVEARLYEKAKKNGWVDEFRYIMEKMEAVKPGESISLKPDYAFCRKRCNRDAKPVACVETCMK